jgi:hypothetical protein
MVASSCHARSAATTAISQLVTYEIAMTRRMNVLALQAERVESVEHEARVLKKILTKPLKKAAPNSRLHALCKSCETPSARRSPSGAGAG